MKKITTDSDTSFIMFRPTMVGGKLKIELVDNMGLGENEDPLKTAEIHSRWEEMRRIFTKNGTNPSTLEDFLRDKRENP